MLTLPALFVPLLAAIPLPAAAITSTVWHKVLVTQDQLTAANRSRTFQVSEEILCAIHATRTTWCHLFTYNANDCVVYDLQVEGMADPPPEDQDAVTFTARRHSVSTCDYPFSTQEVGCVHLLKEDKTWYEARKYCESLGADLAVVQADKFQSLQQFLADNADGTGVWVGVKAREWLNGRNVSTSEWLPLDDEPNEKPNYCARMKEASHTHFLADKSCNVTFPVLCMRG